MSGDGDYRFDTRAIHAGEASDPTTGAHGVPLYQNSTYAFRSFDQVEQFQAGSVPHYFYARGGNPTVRCLELKLANLEGAEAAAAANNGMAAIAATLAELSAGGRHLVAADSVYTYTDELLSRDLPDQGVRVTRVDVTDLAAVEAAMRPETAAIYCESYSNPLMRVADIPALAEIAHGNGDRAGAKLVVDNTFLSPALLRPLEQGADVAIHSATKYLAGTGQAMGGAVAGSRAFVSCVSQRLTRSGGVMTPFAAWLLLAGVKTLPLRMARHCENALALARLLEADEAVARVHYPGLPSDPGHAAGERMTGGRHGGLLTVELRGGRAAARAFVDGLRLCTIAVSLGEATTLVWPLGEGRVRIAAGLEDPADLLADISAGLAAGKRAESATFPH